MENEGLEFRHVLGSTISPNLNLNSTGVIPQYANYDSGVIPQYTNYNYGYDGVRKTLVQEVQSLKNTIESVSVILKELNDKVKLLSAQVSAEDELEDELKYERRKLKISQSSDK